ncbi:MAG: hypothetical protein WDA75_22850 [Candidatus Latescibacterota bacterium]|jgi:hypothetical protein
MRKIKFSRRYKKLKGEVFTTVRIWSPEKERYFQEGRLYDVLVCDDPFPTGLARLHLVVLRHPDTLTPQFVDYDTDSGAYQVPKHTEVMVLVFQWEVRPDTCGREVSDEE